MTIVTRCKLLLKAMFQWNVLLKSSLVALLVGTALTYTNYGNVLNDAVWPAWWKLMLNFVVPFVVEALLCVCLNVCRQSEVTEVILHEIKQDQHAATALSEVAVYSGMVEHSKGVSLTTVEADPAFLKDYTLSSRHTWPCPELEPAATGRPCYTRTHTNSMSMFTVDELAGFDEMRDGDAFEIRPLPKESARKCFRAKSMGCVSDLHGRQRIRISNAERLHVFNNGLYAGDSPPPPQNPCS